MNGHRSNAGLMIVVGAAALAAAIGLLVLRLLIWLAWTAVGVLAAVGVLLLAAGLVLRKFRG